MKIAKFAPIDALSGYDIILKADTAIELDRPGFRRVSEVVDVDFPPLPEPSAEERLEQIRQELEALDKAHISKCNALKRQYAELAKVG